jgi:hypothetical protein
VAARSIGLRRPEPMLLQARVAEHVQKTAEIEHVRKPIETATIADELPDALTRIPGLLGELTTGFATRRCSLSAGWPLARR